MDDLSSGTTAWLAVGLVSLSTLGGAWLARLEHRRLSGWLAVASALMLVTALADLLPDAWHHATDNGVPLWWVGLATAMGFVVVTYFTRGGHGHGQGGFTPARRGLHSPGAHRRVKEVVSAALFGGMGTAAALAVHRAIEGATLAVSASAVIVIALMVHSASEGLALAALLDMARQPLGPWLALSCASPAVGVVIATIRPLPGRLVPILLGMVTGVLLRTAVVGLQMLSSRQKNGRLPRRYLWIASGAAGAMVAVTGLLHLMPGAAHPGGGAMARTPVQSPTPRPAPTPTPTPSPSPVDRWYLRAALASGRLSLSQLMDRTDLVTRGTYIAWLLGALPGYEEADVSALLKATGIGPRHTLGELTRRQRRTLLDAISDTGKAIP
ncbi:hypothetical protein [Acrocarpospora catenulata]|uniref:hypothetical protein n=1 Tax=Acrocarpospora catenulata TaxID=2836182 RepID=UPI001BDAE0EF|nr:hypothetical protein [Acrocarpospora catenulata]